MLLFDEIQVSVPKQAFPFLLDGFFPVGRRRPSAPTVGHLELFARVRRDFVGGRIGRCARTLVGFHRIIHTAIEAAVQVGPAAEARFVAARFVLFFPHGATAVTGFHGSSVASAARGSADQKALTVSAPTPFLPVEMLAATTA
jgi:hypothetical protein